MKIIYIIAITLFTMPVAFAQQWSYQAGGYGLGAVPQGIQRVSNDLLFIQASASPMMRSDDGGESWKFVNHAGNVFLSTEPAFIDLTTGWAGGAKVDAYAPPSGPFGSPFIPQVLKTTDGGKNWLPVPVAGLDGLNLARFIHFFDANRGVIAGETIDFEMLVFRTADGGHTWTRVFSSAALFSVADAQFINATTGYICASNGMIKTVDGGATWQVMTNPADPAKNQTITKQSFVSVQEGWISGSGNLLARTIDGGATWTRVSSTFDEGGTIEESGIYISGLKFSDATHGYISSMFGKLLYTADGGATWHDRTPGDIDMGYGQEVAFLDNAQHIVMVTSGDAIVKSGDGGVTWEKRLDPFLWDSSIFDITFSNNTHGWAAGYSGSLLHTTDGGRHWAMAQTPAWQSELQSYQTLLSVSTESEASVWAVGTRGTILHTANGTDWTASTYYSEKDFNDVFFLKDKGKGWIVGQDYTLLHYNGTEWQPQVESAENTPALKAVYFVNENTGWAVGESGTILKTTNGGAAWSLKKSGILRQLNDVYFVDEHVGYAVGNNDYILKSTDGGETWRYQVIPHAFVGNVEAVYFATPHRGWVAASDEHRGAIYATTDGGHTWTRAPQFGTSMLAMHFNDMNHGWAADDSGKIYSFYDEATGQGDYSEPLPVMDFFPHADTLFNFNRAMLLLRDSTTQYGPFLGKNGAGHEEFAEKYHVEGQAWVAGVMVYHHGRVVHGNNIAEYNVFTVDEKGFPDRKVGRKDIYFKEIDVSKKASRVLFNEPVPVNESFFVTFNLTDYYHGGFDGDDVGIMHTANNTRPESGDAAQNVVRVHDHSDRVWKPVVDAHLTSGYRGYLAIFPIVYRENLVTDAEDGYTGALKLLPAYPNPASDKVNVSYALSKPADVAVYVYDMQGRKINEVRSTRIEAGVHQQELNVAGLKPGLYIYKVRAGNASRSSKFVVY